jgi:hypothetical protein
MKTKLLSLAAAFLFSVATMAQAQLLPTVLTSVRTDGLSGNATIDKPDGTAAGDLLVAGIALEKGEDAQINPPNGWTLIRRTDNGTDAGLATYYKIAGASEPASYEFGLTGQKWAAGITRITGADIANPIQASSGGIGGVANVTAPSLTTTKVNALVLAFFTNKKGTTYTPPFGTTEIYDAPNTEGGGPSQMLATFAQVLPGETGNQIAIPHVREKCAAQQVAITADPASVNHGLLTIGRLETSGSRLGYEGFPGRIYNIEYTDELLDSGTIWTPLPDQTTDAFGRVVIDDTSATGARFYRATLVP